MYEKVYLALYYFAHYELFGINVCQIIAVVIPLRVLILSRLTSSVLLKIFSIPIGLLFYFFPTVVDFFHDVLR
jgi:Gpi18-like mannosyltransferase